MKPFACFLFALAILGTSACKKEATLKTVDMPAANATLRGYWRVIGNMISSGGPMYFVPASGNDQALFNADGSMSGSAFPNFKLYTVKDSVTIKMTSADKATYENYIYKIKSDTLTLGLAGPIVCTEGCAVVLVKEYFFL
jgi:hypothetical protein